MARTVVLSRSACVPRMVRNTAPEVPGTAVLSRSACRVSLRRMVHNAAPLEVPDTAAVLPPIQTAGASGCKQIQINQ